MFISIKINVRRYAGIDELSGRFLKDDSRVLSKRVSELRNFWFKLGSFSYSFKIAKLKSLIKKGPKTNAPNYRPISLIPLMSKIIEKRIHEQASSFLTNNEILYFLYILHNT